MKPHILVLKTDGTNCDEELAYAFSLAGGTVTTVHMNELRKHKSMLKNYQILALPGGFSYGDDVASGKVLATELVSFLADSLQSFISRPDTAILGVCNGFQVLVRTGLLPFGKLGTMDVTLTNNDSGQFECRWINLQVEKNTACVFLQNMQQQSLSYQVAHGEGKFFTDPDTLKAIEKQQLVALRYADSQGDPTNSYPENPNGSLNAIAGICDPTGRILGLMPHPERFVMREQHPNWRRQSFAQPHGLPFFTGIITYVKHA